MNNLMSKEVRLILVKIIVSINGLLLIRSGLVLGGIDLLYLSLADVVLIPIPKTRKRIRNLIAILLILLGCFLIIWGYYQVETLQATIYMLIILLGMLFVILRAKKNSILIDTFLKT